jgi:hypothetical protein
LRFGGFWVVPKTGFMRAQFFFFYLYVFRIDVKDTSPTLRRVPTGLSVGLE